MLARLSRALPQVVATIIGIATLVAGCAAVEPRTSSVPLSEAVAETTTSLVVVSTTRVAPLTTSTGAATTTTEDPAKPTIVVNGARLAYNCYGEGAPAVIVELGMVQSRDRSETWFAFGETIAGIAETNRVCVYGRRGIGGSEPTKLPVTTRDQVEDLRALIEALELETPVVLVGHSIGAYNLRLFTATHRELVAGLVFVDGTDPGLDAYDPPPPVSPIERIDMYASAEQVSAVTDLGDVPIYVLTGARKAPDWWINELQPRLAALSTNATHVVLELDHYLHVSNPQAVVDAVAWVVAQGG